MNHLVACCFCAGERLSGFLHTGWKWFRQIIFRPDNVCWVLVSTWCTRCWRNEIVHLSFRHWRSFCHCPQWRIQDFPEGGREPSRGGVNTPNFPENCMKSKEFGRPGGGVRPSRPPLDPPMVHFPTEDTTALAVCEVEVFADTGNWDFHQKTTFGYMWVKMSYQYCHNWKSKVIKVNSIGNSTTNSLTGNLDLFDDEIQTKEIILFNVLRTNTTTSNAAILNDIIQGLVHSKIRN